MVFPMHQIRFRPLAGLEGPASKKQGKEEKGKERGKGEEEKAYF